MSSEMEETHLEQVDDDIADVEFAELQLGAEGEVLDDEERERNLEILYDIPLTVTVRLGDTQMPVKDLLTLGAGAVIELDRCAGESVDLTVNGLLVGRGDVVVINDNFGLRITEILNPTERLKAL